LSSLNAAGITGMRPPSFSGQVWTFTSATFIDRCVCQKTSASHPPSLLEDRGARKGLPAGIKPRPAALLAGDTFPLLHPLNPPPSGGKVGSPIPGDSPFYFIQMTEIPVHEQ
jgi:hypothetical protein